MLMTGARAGYRFGMANVDLRRLRYFVAVAEERHFGGRRHGCMSAPPLSQRIRELEADLGWRCSSARAAASS